jgi:hypothetical protein
VSSQVKSWQIPNFLDTTLCDKLATDFVSLRTISNLSNKVSCLYGNINRLFGSWVNIQIDYYKAGEIKTKNI